MLALVYQHHGSVMGYAEPDPTDTSHWGYPAFIRPQTLWKVWLHSAELSESHGNKTRRVVGQMGQHEVDGQSGMNMDYHLLMTNIAMV